MIQGGDPTGMPSTSLFRHILTDQLCSWLVSAGLRAHYSLYPLVVSCEQLAIFKVLKMRTLALTY